MNNLKVFSSIQEFINYRDTQDNKLQIGFVPTMGALHAGHASLIKKSSEENDVTIVSIFVNPTQFNNQDDLKNYPRTWESDLKLAEENGAQIVLAPEFENIYPDNYRYKLTESTFSKQLCGAHRPGHFDGVLTVVMKLLNIVNPGKAYFGEKDFQQLQLIRDMTKCFFMRTEIIACTTKRAEDGLALSSRNIRLTSEGRKKAPLIYKTLSKTADIQKAQDNLASENIELEYLEEHYGRRYIAAYIDGVRLIDNVKI